MFHGIDLTAAHACALCLSHRGSHLLVNRMYPNVFGHKMPTAERKVTQWPDRGLDLLLLLRQRILRLLANVNGPAGQLSCEPNVLCLFPNGK